MVVLVDLDDADDDSFPSAHYDDGRPNPNVNGFSAALGCYPIVRQLARQLDLNSLHHLSRTCRQFRANLLEYRDQLVRQTLRCDADGEDDHGTAPRRAGTRMLTLTSGRVARCARDMVAECQRCAAVVCRNCIVKPPPTPTLRARHRRLCRTCTRAPIAFLTAASESPLSGTPDPPRTALLDDDAADAPRAFTAPAFERTPCICDHTVWLCQPCGQHLKNADTMYVRAWTWRTRYSHYLGGVGTGAGEGNEGVECGRGAQCLAAHFVEHQVDCNASSDPAYSASPETGERQWTGTSYYAQEVEGIGGVVKRKLKKQVRVGECVKVYDDERDKSIRWLERELSGCLRSWCSWCERVVLGDEDRAEARG
ncbi:hypothetical protein PMIN06_009714 [Paraphaeosphaeria minitans]|uniref:Uncharacterized protein n=1 Tax=Paraphaeosphaeria minitans TaxID=565426 RepID=A0A9P6KJN1_9PLEO|nr:hypothetical protein PMIN01_12412 [Paraphaeosphaeria minitans]